MREALKGLANVREASLVQEDLLEDERGDCLGEFAPSLHDAQTEGDDLRSQEEVNDLLFVRLSVCAGVRGEG